MANAANYLESLNALTGGKPMRHILVDMFTMLSDEKKWTQHARARNSQGENVRPEDSSACCWCLLGAAAVVCNPHGIAPPSVIRYLDDCVREYSGGNFETCDSFNDVTDHESLLKFLDFSLARVTQ